MLCRILYGRKQDGISLVPPYSIPTHMLLTFLLPSRKQDLALPRNQRLKLDAMATACCEQADPLTCPSRRLFPREKVLPWKSRQRLLQATSVLSGK